MSEALPEDLLWEDGHASDVAVSAFADGEAALLSAQVVAHLSACSDCSNRLGEAALVTRSVTNALRTLDPPLPPLVAPGPTAAASPAARPVPWRAVTASLGLAILGLSPRLALLPHHLAALAVRVMHAAPVLSHGGLQVVRDELGGGLVPATLLCAGLLIAGGLAVTRALPQSTVA